MKGQIYGKTTESVSVEQVGRAQKKKFLMGVRVTK